MSDFALADSFATHIVPIGATEEPVALVDGVMQDWRSLRGAAAQSQFRDVGKKGGFPGLRAPLPALYAKALLRRLDPLIKDVFFAGRSMKLARFDCNFSLVTYRLDQLQAQQKIPHIDIANENRIALLHYLCSEDFGGTAFYQQSATTLGQVGAEDRDVWGAARQEEMASLTPDAGYPDDSTPGYRRIASFAAKPDRLLAYRSNNLHSGVIDRPKLLNADPLKGRLTANFFVDYEPDGSD